MRRIVSKHDPDLKNRPSLKSYILSPDREMRSPNLLFSLEKLKIPFEIIDASSITETKRYLQSNYVIRKKSLSFSTSHKITEAQLACTYGHFLMHEAFNKNKDEWGLFLENDATIDIKLLIKILRSLKNLPRGVILLGACGGWARKNPEWMAQDVAIHRVFNSAITGSHAYLVHISLIEKIIHLEKNLVSLADEFIRKDLNLYITVPYASLQNGLGVSSIPLSSHSSSVSVWRRGLSSFLWDFRDIWRLGRFGNRALRLQIFERALSRLLLKLPGCNAYHLSQIGSNKDQP